MLRVFTRLYPKASTSTTSSGSPTPWSSSRALDLLKPLGRRNMYRARMDSLHADSATADRRLDFRWSMACACNGSPHL